MVAYALNKGQKRAERARRRRHGTRRRRHVVFMATSGGPWVGGPNTRLTSERENAFRYGQKWLPSLMASCARHPRKLAATMGRVSTAVRATLDDVGSHITGNHSAELRQAFVV